MNDVGELAVNPAGRSNTGPPTMKPNVSVKCEVAEPDPAPIASTSRSSSKLIGTSWGTKMRLLCSVAS